MRPVAGAVRMGLYQCWCIVWYLRRGDVATAAQVAHMPSHRFAAGNIMMRAAYLAGAYDVTHGKIYGDD